MDALNWAVFALGIPAAMFAGISKGGFGSGAAFASASILALVFEPAMALGIMLPLLMLIDVSSLPAYWRKWSGPEVRLLIIGGVPGTLLGAVFFGMVDSDERATVVGISVLRSQTKEIGLGSLAASLTDVSVSAIASFSEARSIVASSIVASSIEGPAFVGIDETTL